MKVTTKRQSFGGYLIMLDGKDVGRINKSARGDFGLFIDRVYWKRGVPNRRCGTTGRSYPRLRDCVAAAQRWFEAYPPVGTVLYTRAEVTEAWACVRRHNHSIPDECLDQMRAVLLAALDE